MICCHCVPQGASSFIFWAVKQHFDLHHIKQIKRKAVRVHDPQKKIFYTSTTVTNPPKYEEKEI